MSGAPGPRAAFPRVDGRRSSTVTGRAVLAAAAAAVDPALAARIAAEPRWRTAYAEHVRALVVATAGPAVSGVVPGVAVARAGLAALAERMVLTGPDGDIPLGPAAAAAPARALGTTTLRGTASRERQLTVPLGGRRLAGADLHRQLDAWVAAGVVEPSHAAAVRAVSERPDWLDLSDVQVGLLGAGAELAPLRALLRWGATVRAVDLPDPAIQDRLATAAARGAGQLLCPTADGRPGVDLTTDPAAVRAWLTEAPGRLVVANTVYADGAAFPPLAAAADAVTAALLADRPDTVPATLATPTDVFLVPPEVVADARARWAAGGWRRGPQRAVRGVSRGRLFVPHYPTTVRAADGRDLGVADTVVLQQGPNYTLAKQVQRWRAAAAAAAGHRVSANVAPPTRTRSVLRNRALAAAYAGAHRFGVEVFAPATSATLMAALLVHDLRADPAATGAGGGPEALYAAGANHGGLWRSAWEPRSVLGLAVLLGLAARR